MKKFILSVITIIVTMFSQVFGMYEADSDWIDFLVDKNQLKARIDQFGVTIGNGTIKGTFGFRGNNVIFQNDGKGYFTFPPTVSAGIGYTYNNISTGLGYSYTYKNRYLSTHTPVLALNFLNDNLRIVVPISIAIANKSANELIVEKYKYTGISTCTHIRYYTGIDVLSQLRLYIKYGMNQKQYATTYNNNIITTKELASSLGIDFRIYFGANIDNLQLKPFMKITYDTALNSKGKFGSTSYNIKAGDELGLSKNNSGVVNYYQDPYYLRVLPSLGITANSDIVQLYVEPGLGYQASHEGKRFDKIKHNLAWSAYGEIYITPLPNLEWYFEIDTASTTDPNLSQNVLFATTTGITWYLPDFN